MEAGLTDSEISENSSVNELQLSPGVFFLNRYKVVKKLGEGGFGAVYMVEDNLGSECALKIESTRGKSQVTKMEVAVLRSLKSKHKVRYHGCGMTAKVNYILMGLVGPNLGELKRKCPAQKFTTQTSVRLILQCIQGIEDLHRSGYLHRDIKPSNFAIGCYAGDQKTVFMLDFGLARRFKTAQGTLREERESVGFRGTIRYCSLNAHSGKELGRHDDLISCVYMFVEFLRGQLPWRHVADKKRTRALKEDTSPDELFASCPEELHWIMHHLHKLSFVKAPKYEAIKRQVRQIIERKKFKEEHPLDWMEGGSYHDYFQNTRSSTQRSDTDSPNEESDRTTTSFDDFLYTAPTEDSEGTKTSMEGEEDPLYTL